MDNMLIGVIRVSCASVAKAAKLQEKVDLIQYLIFDMRFTRNNSSHMARTFTQLHSDITVKSEELINYVEEDFGFEPSQAVVDSILRYSQSYEVRNSTMVGLIETVSN